MSAATVTEDRSRVRPPDVWPPDDGDGGGGGGGDGQTPQEGGPPLSASRLAVIFLCASIVMFFSAAISALVIFRDQLGSWPPPNYPDMRGPLWLSTALIAASSVAGFLAMAAARPEDRARFRALLALTLALGLAFCVSQGSIWRDISASSLTRIASSNFNALFYFITGLHVLHVGFGLIYLGRCVVGAGRADDFARLRHACGNCMIYWHFIGVVWLVLLGFLLP
ncbi:MAG: cytochrome c oxidase subunit 3 [Planctomycetes bacterium]|nr:cytochrome c oxidase subunit 3 [Planctomycetota bacterium]